MKRTNNLFVYDVNDILLDKRGKTRSSTRAPVFWACPSAIRSQEVTGV